MKPKPIIIIRAARKNEKPEPEPKPRKVNLRPIIEMINQKTKKEFVESAKFIFRNQGDELTHTQLRATALTLQKFGSNEDVVSDIENYLEHVVFKCYNDQFVFGSVRRIAKANTPAEAKIVVGKLWDKVHRIDSPWR